MRQDHHKTDLSVRSWVEWKPRWATRRQRSSIGMAVWTKVRSHANSSARLRSGASHASGASRASGAPRASGASHGSGPSHAQDDCTSGRRRGPRSHEGIFTEPEVGHCAHTRHTYVYTDMHCAHRVVMRVSSKSPRSDIVRGRVAPATVSAGGASTSMPCGVSSSSSSARLLPDADLCLCVWVCLCVCVCVCVFFLCV